MRGKAYPEPAVETSGLATLAEVIYPKFWPVTDTSNFWQYKKYENNKINNYIRHVTGSIWWHNDFMQ